MIGYEEMTRIVCLASAAREGALNNLSPALCANGLNLSSFRCSRLERWRPRRLARLRLAAEPANPRMSLVTQHRRKPPIRQRGRSRSSRRDASVPAVQTLKLRPLELCAGFGYAPTFRRPRRRPLQRLALREHFVVAASATTNLLHARFPAQSAGLRLLSAPSRANGRSFDRPSLLRLRLRSFGGSG